MRLLIDGNNVLDVLQKLSLIFHFEDLKESDLKNVAEKKWDDFPLLSLVNTCNNLYFRRIKC